MTIDSLILLCSYVATYIGRPLALDDNDYDTPLPTDDPDDMGTWQIPSTDPGPLTQIFPRTNESTRFISMPAQVIPTFRHRAQLCELI